MTPDRSALLILADELDRVRDLYDALRAERDSFVTASISTNAPASPATPSDAITTVNARADALHAALTQAVAFVERQGGYATAEDQAALRGWRALLAEGRR